MISPKGLKEIDRAVLKYPAGHQQSAVIAALAIAQRERGWLLPELMQFIADYLQIPAISVQEVATFYNMYETTSVGTYKITLCTNLPCELGGAEKTAEYLKKKLRIDFGETTPDGRFTLKEGECFGACGDAPVVLLNNHRMCSFMSCEKIDQLLEELST
ncbi:NADH-quinone oxidoreductase subunit NuoE [Candidatus Vallotia tarda]|uniref:NADH-quinone oxidoreductase subunit E n=1 Tax=Candidatus Vallotiella hemipterorum TaxID=1177213 RepID=A0A916JTA3_9BURK|nr:NADH-quinone oxidoreductase subunit NuoE [Candidatus Vallotia tarda]CAG7601110.1 NADH-quinone oxidoreductase subunit E [Candidatus Vallotia tarda]